MRAHVLPAELSTPRTLGEPGTIVIVRRPFGALFKLSFNALPSFDCNVPASKYLCAIHGPPITRFDSANVRKIQTSRTAAAARRRRRRQQQRPQQPQNQQQKQRWAWLGSFRRAVCDR
jgi:hypothetical protein